MQLQIKHVEDAIQQFNQGKMVILCDDPERENEGDLIIPAELITPKIMNFMIRHGSGIVCLAMPESMAQKLALPYMVPAQQNTSSKGTPFTVSIDAKKGITTGVSATDRVKTILVAIDELAKPDDLVKPGHMFPLVAKAGGVFERQGHTEGSADLASLAGYKRAAILCEIMNPDGTMACGADLVTFAQEHALQLLSIDDIMTYRALTENIIHDEAISRVNLEHYGDFTLSVIREKFTEKEHMVLTKGKIDTKTPVLTRIHSSCATGDIFSSNRCDCNKQLHYSLKQVSQHGGVLIYLNQEGRDIGLFNKIKSYALQDKGYDTVEANVHLGLPTDARKYYIAAAILRKLGVQSVKLLTNNPAKINDLLKYGIHTVSREAIPVFLNQYNKMYLQAKKSKLQHLFNDDFINDIQEMC